MYKIYDITVWFHNEAGELEYKDKEVIAFNEEEAKSKIEYYFDNIFTITIHKTEDLE